MREILTGVDQEAGRVLDRALLEAETTGRPLRVVHVWSTPTWAGGPSGGYDLPAFEDSSRWAKNIADDQLQKALLQRASDATVTTSTQAAQGDAGDVLARAGVEAGLVVVGGRSHGALLSAVLGSATAHVLHYSPGPVMVVPAGAAPGPYRRVVVGVEDADCSRAALRWALDAGRRHRCPVVALHALAITASPVPMSAQLTDAQDEAEIRTWLQAEVDRATGGAGDVEVTTKARDGSPAAALLDEAGPEDLLVVGSRGRGGFMDLVLGSVATQCSQHARGVVVVVRAGQERLADEPDRAAAVRDQA